MTVPTEISPTLAQVLAWLPWVLGPLLAVMLFLFIFRIVLTWYPQADQSKFPFNLIVWPTEPFLAPTRRLIPPIGGVDITPIVWVGLFSLVRELLLGQQGLITMAVLASQASS